MSSKRHGILPTAVDLFSGCGGLSWGLKRAGFNVMAAVEILQHARDIYSQNHPEVRLFEDIRTLSGVRLLQETNLKRGELDLLAGCPPCQGFSTIRRKNRPQPALDARNELIFEFLRLAEEMMPKTILMENVPGLMTDDRMRVFKEKLRLMNYQFSIGVLNAADFGVPQRRKRMILIASRFGNISLPEPKGSSVRKTVRDAIGNLPKPWDCNIPLHKLYSKQGKAVLEKIRRIPRNGGSRRDLGTESQLNCHKKLNDKIGGGFTDVYGRLSWDKESATITRFCNNPSKGRFIHPEQNRALTVYEAALLQGFPKSYKLPPELGILKLSSMIGEALPPTFAEAQAKHIRRHLETNVLF